MNASKAVSINVPFDAFVLVATDRLHQLHYRCHRQRENLVHPVFPHQVTTAIDRTEAFFRRSGPHALRWCGWRA
ncbi:MAG: hypothetical protein AAFR84_17740 [Pseudomonadota bacterium]